MIDFRYHLISIIAVFLALGLGVLMGSVVLDDQFVKHLENQVDAFDQRNDELQEQIDALEAQVEASQAYAVQSAPWLLEDQLEGRSVVVIELEGIDGGTVSELRSTIEEAGGAVPTTITLTERFALPGEVERDQLALAIDSTASTPRDIRIEAATMLGDRISAAAVEAITSNRPRSDAQQRLGTLLQDLQDTEFVAVDGTPDVAVVPSGALFLFVGGTAEGPGYDPAPMSVGLVSAMSERGSPVLAAEPLDSDWGLVSAIRDDGEASARVSTVDQAGAIEGRIAVVLGLRQQFEGTTDHYGVAEGATKVIPEPSTSD
ncbi:MAG: copper transporter [Actinomycetota bacterium]